MKCGLEIHQRLDTNKLFCNCPSPPTESEVIPSRIIKRRLHPVSSEIGTLDSAALFEASSDKSFTYLAPYQYSCLVELDEEPPHKINPEALLFALELANYFGSTPVDEVQVMRKTVIDGSDTSGFQRTMLLAVGGSVETSRGHVGIQTICLEEESAGIIERKKGETLYSLGRLGIPLVEIATAPEIIDGEHAKEVASIIGEILRLSGRVQRGIGTIRQDLNISVEGGARVEIKGAQELNQLPTLIENEIKRQNSLLELMNNLKSRFGEFSGFPAYISEVTSVFTNTRCAMIKKMLSQKCGVFGIRLPKHKGILGFELCPGIRYGTELSFYAKTAGVGGILHSDEDLSRYSISNEELEKLKTRLNLGEDDAFVLVIGDERTARKALLAVWTRAMELAVPSETRRANADGTTSYMRPLGGGARMYPETDIPPIRITKEMLEEINRRVESKKPHKIKEKVERLLNNKELASQMLKSKHLNLFLSLSEKFGNPSLIAVTLTKTLTQLRREGFESKNLEITLSDLFSAYSSGLFAKAALPEILKKMVTGKTAQEAVAELNLSKISGEELRRIILQEERDISKIMEKYRLRIDSEELRSAMNSEQK